MTTNRALTWKHLLLITITLSLTSCLDRSVFYRREREAAERAVTGFHGLWNEEKYEAIYNLLKDESRKPEHKDSFVAALKKVREKWGKAQGTKLRNIYFPRRTSVIMFCDTKFEKGDGRETFFWLLNGNEARLSEYLVT